MNKHTIREDDYLYRREHLVKLSDDELKTLFWELADKATSPLIDLARTHTSPAIERSVLLRMGFSSLEAGALVKKVIEHNLMGKGAGHVVYRYSQLKKTGIREAGLALLNDKGWKDVTNSFEVRK